LHIEPPITQILAQKRFSECLFSATASTPIIHSKHRIVQLEDDRDSGVAVVVAKPPESVGGHEPVDLIMGVSLAAPAALSGSGTFRIARGATAACGLHKPMRALVMVG
jgi:hypothetical protein